MASRRGFVSCAMCSALGLTATSVEAPAEAAGVVRKTLGTIASPGDGKVVILMTLEAPAGAIIPRHAHPGIESVVVTEGAVALAVAGLATRVYEAGEGFQVAAGVPHAGTVVKSARLTVTYVVAGDAPLSASA